MSNDIWATSTNIENMSENGWQLFEVLRKMS